MGQRSGRAATSKRVCARSAPNHRTNWWTRITGQLADGQQRRELGKTRTAVAVVFASLVLMSGFGAAAFAAAGGNGNGNNGNGNGNSGTPAGCVEGQGQVTLHNPNC